MQKYKGLLTLHSEMCCGHWPQFHDNRGLHGDKKQYWNWDWTINFGRETKIKHLLVWDKHGEILYDGPWTYSRLRTLQTLHYIPSPQEIHSDKWLDILFTYEKLYCEVETTEMLKALKK